MAMLIGKQGTFTTPSEKATAETTITHNALMSLGMRQLDGLFSNCHYGMTVGGLEFLVRHGRVGVGGEPGWVVWVKGVDSRAADVSDLPELLHFIVARASESERERGFRDGRSLSNRSEYDRGLADGRQESAERVAIETEQQRQTATDEIASSLRRDVCDVIHTRADMLKDQAGALRERVNDAVRSGTVAVLFTITGCILSMLVMIGVCVACARVGRIEEGVKRQEKKLGEISSHVQQQQQNTARRGNGNGDNAAP